MVMERSRLAEVRIGDASRLFDGRRLTLARQLAGLRKNALAAQIDKSPTAVAAYESNSKRPAPATVAQLCLTLGVDPSFSSRDRSDPKRVGQFPTSDRCGQHHNWPAIKLLPTGWSPAMSAPPWKGTWSSPILISPD